MIIFRAVNDQQSRRPQPAGRWPIQWIGRSVLATSVLLAGCAPPHYDMRSWQHGFKTAVPITEGAGVASRRSASFGQAVPVRCIRAKAVDALLPPGCANDLNLARMVAHPNDLLRGRVMGPPRAAPVARAAEAAIDASGKQTAERNAAVRAESESQGAGYDLP